MDREEIGWEGLDLTDLYPVKDKWRAVVNAVMNLRFPEIWGNLTVGGTVSFARTALLCLLLKPACVIMKLVLSYHDKQERARAMVQAVSR
jgi:hypothetical protein